MEDRVLVQTDHPAYVRDIHTKALLPNSRKEADEYQVKAAMFETSRKNREEMDTIKKEVSDIKTDLEEIKTLLIKALK